MSYLRGVYEVAIRVKDLSKAEKFYCSVLGLEIGLRDPERRWLFLRVGGQKGMIVLQEDRGTWPTQHFAFRGDAGDLERAAASLRAHGIGVQGPVLLKWMPARSIYFSDPDGHDLELCAPESTRGA
jgi:catechol 2,3-dioxygenase-like lactoylglutathione lyase family enzyme